jgi:hypothetical protein
MLDNDLIFLELDFLHFFSTAILIILSAPTQSVLQDLRNFAKAGELQ